jgi:tetratricopeptide (TPR) repeat protein
MARNIQLKAEEARFRDTFSKIPLPQKSVARAEVPQAPPEPAPDPVGDLLKEAQDAFNSGDMVKARKVFERVLSDFDRNNGAAEYGLGLIASKVGYSEEAKQHFDKAVHTDSTKPGMKVWSYIYLGRIFDLECNRDRAVEYYQQAIKVGDNSRDAQTAATEGVQKAYRDNCK